MEFLGSVNASNEVDADSLESVRYGHVAGRGLLGAALEAGLTLAYVTGEYAYEQTEENANAVEKARIAFYLALKAIQTWVALNAPPATAGGECD